eukprot:62227_1
MLSVLDRISPKIKNLVSGYCRSISGNAFIAEIVQLCTIYCAQSDRFYPDSIYHNMKIDSEDETIISKSGDGIWGTILGETVVQSNETYFWTFQIVGEKPTEISNTWKIVIGIVPRDWKKTTNASYTFVAQNYGFIGANGTTNAKGKQKVNKDKFGSNEKDKLTMILDLKLHTLSYIINDKDNGIRIHYIPPNDYRLAVSLCKGRKVKLISSGWYQWALDLN